MKSNLKPNHTTMKTGIAEQMKAEHPDNVLAELEQKQAGKIGPFMQRWFEQRKTLPENVLLFYRLGDFYETFSGDAEKAAKLTATKKYSGLTKRNGVSMYGFPFHSAQGFINLATLEGYRVELKDLSK